MTAENNKQTYLESGQKIELKKLSGVPYIDALLNKREGAPIKWISDPFLTKEELGQTKTVISYSFPTGSENSAGYSYPDDVGEITPVPFSAQQQEDIRAAFKEIEKYIDVNFIEVIEGEETVGTIRLAINTITDEQGVFLPGIVGTADPPSDRPRGGDIWFNKSYAGSDFSTGLVAMAQDSQKVGSQTPIGDVTVMYHEIFHVLGVEHPNDNPDIPFPEDKNSREYTVMAGEFSAELSSQKTIGEKQYAIPSTPMAYDVAALQYLYGSNTLHNSADTSYTFDPDLPEIKLVWDGGGTDTLNFKNFSQDSNINLSPGSYSTVPFNGWKLENNFSIAFETYIENVIAGSGADTLIGNSLNNRLTGGPGNDVIDGKAGVDLAVYTTDRKEATLNKFVDYISTAEGMSLGSAWNVVTANDTDTLRNIERLKFNDTYVALDLDGNAGKTVKLLSAILGSEAAVNKTYVGAGLRALDNGMTYEALMSGAMSFVFGPTPSGSSVVDALYTNLTGLKAPQSILDEYGKMLDLGTLSYTNFGITVAEHSMNASNIDLIGLQQSGIEYMI